MKIEYIRQFITTAETQNLLEASKLEFVEHSTLSKHIKKMESELGFRLFERGCHVMNLTDKGYLYYNKCKKMIHDYDNFCLELKNAENSDGFVMALSIGVHFADELNVFNDIFRAFMNSHPGIGVDLHYSSDHAFLKKLLDNELDIVLEMYTPDNINEDIDFYKIIDLELPVIYSSKRNVSSSPIFFEGLKSEMIVVPDLDVHIGLRSYLETIIDKGYISKEKIISCGSFEDMLSKVEANEAIAFIPKPYVHLLQSSINSICIENLPTLPLLVLWNKKTKNQNTTRFIIFLKRILKNEITYE